MARDLLRPRYWLWPLNWDDHSQWPCCCTDPVHALEEEHGRSVYACKHGSWLMVNDPSEAVAHDNDILWGDLILCQQEIDFAALPAARRAEIEAERKREAEAMKAAHAEMAAQRKRLEDEFAKDFAEASKEWEAEAASKGRGHRRDSGSTHSSAFAAAGGGAPQPAKPARVPGKRYDRKTGLPMPCRCHAHEGVLGNIAPASSGINKKGEKFSYPAGCQQHDDFVAGRTAKDCEFFHIGDAEWRLLLAMAPKAGGGSWRG
jgi:hypothetical protein